MSVRMNTYVMWGVLFPFKHFSAEQRDKLAEYEDNPFSDVNGVKGIQTLIDGMNGKYIAIGHVFARSEADGGFASPVKLPFVWGEALNTLDLMHGLMDEIGNPRIVGNVQGQWLVIAHYR